MYRYVSVKDVVIYHIRHDDSLISQYHTLGNSTTLKDALKSSDIKH